MFKTSFFFAIFLLLTAFQAQAQEGTRLLILDGAATDPALSEQGRLLGETLLNSVRGKEGVLVATSSQVARQAPLVGERLEGCDQELCLYEAADAITAEFALFGVVRPDPESPNGVITKVGLFTTRTGEITRVDEIHGESVADSIGPLKAAIARVLEPVFEAAIPKFFERRTFMLGTGIAMIGATAAIGGLGWGLEMELALSDPARDAEQKQFALDNGYRAWWFTGFGAVTTAVGVGLLATSLWGNVEGSSE